MSIGFVFWLIMLIWIIFWAFGNFTPQGQPYFTPENREAYEVCIGRGAFNRPSPMHILNQYESLNECPYLTWNRGGWIVGFILFFLLGWRVFGFIIQGVP